MAHNLTSRITALEQQANHSLRKITKIICKGKAPTADEQAWIHEQQAQGWFVIVRTIVEP